MQFQSPHTKKVKISVKSNSLEPIQVESLNLIPKLGYERPSEVFYTGRHISVDLSKAPPVLLQVPEFGILSDATYGVPGCVMAQAKHFKVRFRFLPYRAFGPPLNVRHMVDCLISHDDAINVMQAAAELCDMMVSGLDTCGRIFTDIN